ncbi:ADIPOR-like receptor IZH3 [Cyberlindnera fabianii]|uniref:ADIPOR-like receptor IZH3 n=2 Tax=Cyberlindnera fabianii TaxID=36022 RepID=A0A1V2LBR2_CYBFA|nr:ADIPOR-like receptor IZH3 [Cyberlindnera fabianii]
MSATSTSVGNNDQSLTARGKTHKRYSSEDIRLVQKAHSSSTKFTKVVKGNSMNGDLLGSVDKFIESIELKLDHIESFFVTKQEGKSHHANGDSDDEESYAMLQNLYDTLITIKNSVFSSSTNLESFSTILDEHYGGLLSTIETPETSGFQEQLLTALHFLDAKINQFNSMVEAEAKYLLQDSNAFEASKLSTEDAIKAFEVKFHNYEQAIVEGSQRLLHYHELPFPWRENPFIIHGYRFQSNHLHALKSVCSCHNETSNIWTHLFGAMLMTYILFVSYPQSDLYKIGTTTDHAVMFMYLCASIFCMGSSSMWHTFNGTANMYLRKKFVCVDYTGITVLVSAAVITTEYAALYHHPVLQAGFMTFSVLCCIGGFFFNWSSYFDRPESKPFRIAFFITLSSMGLAAFNVLAWEKGLTHALSYYLPLIRSFIWYLTGVVFYSSLIPECFRTDVIIDKRLPSEETWSSKEVYDQLDTYFVKEPAHTDKRSSFSSLWWVDYVFASHNIWHIFVLMGALGHYTGVYEMFCNIPNNA